MVARDEQESPVIAAAIGELLWKVTPQTPFIIACIIGIIGTIVFAATVEERYAS